MSEITNGILEQILKMLIEIDKTLQEMKQQEKEYWDTWKKAKEAEKHET